MSLAPSANQLRQLDRELETILTSFDSSYVWNHGSVKDGRCSTRRWRSSSRSSCTASRAR
jgi:hypothetical protein